MIRPARLALIRHGESAWIVEGRFQGQGDPPLSPDGERQAAAVGERMALPSAMPAVPVPDGAPLAIWHSPLRRAAQTAQAVHAARGADAPLRPLDDLKELGQGEWEGLTHATVQQRWPSELAAWRDDPLDNHAPGGESLRDGMVRVRRACAIQMPLGHHTAGAPGPARAVCPHFLQPIIVIQRIEAFSTKREMQ